MYFVLNIFIFSMNKLLSVQYSLPSILRPVCHLDDGEVTQLTPRCISTQSTNWDAILPAGQDDILGVVGLVFTQVFFVQYS